MSIKIIGQKYLSPLYFNNNSELAQNTHFWTHNNNRSSAAVNIKMPIFATPPFPCRVQNRTNRAEVGNIKGPRLTPQCSALCHSYTQHHRVSRVGLPQIHLFALLICFGGFFFSVVFS